VAKKSFTPTVYVITVSGRGEFPIDMLRYDLAYPKSEEDSGVILKTFQRGETGTHQVQLASSKQPTPERWKSFGWTVVGFQ
jgi:hypothetical protein